MDIYIKKNKETPLLFKNPWVFPNSIEKVEGKEAKKGDIVRVFDSKNNFIGYGFYNPQSFFKVRILSWDYEQQIDESFFNKSIEKAFNLRVSLYKENYHTGFRLINSEGDGLPGFTCDLYENILVIKLTSYGYYNFLDIIVEALKKNFKKLFSKEIAAIINIITEREKKDEGIPEIKTLLYGIYKEELYFYQDGMKFFLNVKSIQKTGFYFDQRFNRLFLKNFFSGHKLDNILDAFCYVGSFACYLYKEGRSLELVDSSLKALDMAKINCEINEVKSINIIKSDVENYLKSTKKSYDLIVLDPPKLSTKDKDRSNAIKKYTYLNYLASKRIKDCGFLATFSCSGNITFNDFCYSVLNGIKKAGRSHKVIWSSINSPDHPYSLSIEKTGYLKFLLIQVF